MCRLYNAVAKMQYCSPIVGRGDNLQLFISPLLKYEGGLYNITDDKILKSIHWNPPVQGVWRFHIPLWGPVEMQKN